MIALLVAAALLTAHRDAAACISGPGNGTEETGDCTDVKLDFGPKFDIAYMLTLTALPAIGYDFKAMGVGLRRMSKGWHIMGIITGTLTLAFTTGYVSVAGVGSDDGLAVGVAGAAIGAPALIGGIVGLALGKPADDDSAQLTGIVRCSAPGCHVSMPVPRIRQQAGGTTVAVSLLDGRW